MDSFNDFHSFSSFSGFTMDDLLYGQPSTSSSTMNAEIPAEVPAEVSAEETEKLKKKRGRPRKVAAEGEEQRRKQMKVRKNKKRKGNLSDGYPRNSVGWQKTVLRYTGENVNTSKMYLPEGWRCFATRRSSGIHKGSYDLIYVTPTGDRLRSRNELFRWAKKHNSDINPLQFLFNRATNVLMSEDNAKRIIFRNAGLKGKTQRYMQKYLKELVSSQSDTCNTIFTDSGKELLLNDEGMEYQSDIFSNVQQPSLKEGVEESETTSLNEEQTTGTPKKVKDIPKPRRVPVDKTLDCLKSPYFALKNQVPTKPVSIRAIHTSKWIPPRSPFNLIQEDLYHNPWQLLIATIFLNCTTGKLAIPVIHEFLARWPSPHEACSASLFDILEVVELLGLGRTRAATIIRFSHEYLTVDWKKPTELFGIGKYGNDSYKVFCLGQWRTVESEDKYLNMYINWLHNACSRSSNAYRSKGSAIMPK